MLRKLELKNFKKHESIEVVFTAGLNLITGPNYSGKSTILHGVLFCLFGVSAVPGGAGIVLKKGAKSVSGVLEFEAHDSLYRIERTKSSAKIYEDGELAATSNSAVLRAVEEVLGMSKKQYMQLQYSQQKHTEALLTVGSAQLNNTIEDVSGVDLVNNVLDKCKRIVSSKKDKLSVLSDVRDLAEVDLSISNKEGVLHGATDALRNFKKLMFESDQLVSEGRDLLKDAEVSNAGRESVLHQRERASFRIGSRQADIDTYQSIMSEYSSGGDLEELRMEAGRQQRALFNQESKMSEKGRMDRQIQRHTDSLKEDKLSLDALAGRYDALPDIKDIGHLQEQYEQQRDELTKLKAKNEQAKKSLEDGVCSACSRPFDEHLDPESAKAEIRVTRAEVAVLSGVVGDMKEVVDSEMSVKSSYIELEHELDLVRTTISTREEAIADIEKSIAELGDVYSKDELNEMQSKVTEADKMIKEEAAALSEYETAKSKLDVAKEQLAELESELVDLVVPEEVDVDTLTVSLNTARQAQAEANTAVIEADKNYVSIDSELRNLKLSREQAVANNNVVTKLNKELSVAVYLQKFLRDNRDRFLSQVWSGVMGYSSSFASSCTSGEIQGVSREASGGSFEYEEDGETFVVEAASGAQKSIMGLGVQIALSQLLPCSLRSVLLDEPTADMDEEKALTMSTILSQADEQIIMVSHRELDSSGASNVINLGG